MTTHSKHAIIFIALTLASSFLIAFVGMTLTSPWARIREGSVSFRVMVENPLDRPIEMYVSLNPKVSEIAHYTIGPKSTTVHEIYRGHSTDELNSQTFRIFGVDSMNQRSFSLNLQPQHTTSHTYLLRIADMQWSSILQAP